MHFYIKHSVSLKQLKAKTVMNLNPSKLRDFCHQYPEGASLYIELIVGIGDGGK